MPSGEGCRRLGVCICSFIVYNIIKSESFDKGADSIKRDYLPYNSKLKKLARELRNNSTLAEVLLWNELKHRKLKGYRFTRQKPIGNYIVDFFCKELFLAIEIDGSTHNDKGEEDFRRQEELEKLGIKFLRFNDKDVKNNMSDVIQSIVDWVEGEEH
ncbi:MAG: endonuclease domain-containing protein [Kosmotogaceae bacterium]